MSTEPRCWHGFFRGECIADMACTYAVPGRWEAEHPVPEDVTPAVQRVLRREMWEWLPEAFQMSRVRLVDDLRAIEREAAAEALRRIREGVAGLEAFDVGKEISPGKWETLISRSAVLLLIDTEIGAGEPG